LRQSLLNVPSLHVSIDASRTNKGGRRFFTRPAHAGYDRALIVGHEGQVAGHELQYAPSRGVFISRQHELSVLCRALEEAQRRHGQIVLISGEAGIGKTRLAQEFAAVATSRAVSVLWGRCVQGETSPPYWPWAQIVGSFAERCNVATLRRLLGPTIGRLSLIVPQVGERLGFPTVADTDADRFQISNAVHRFLQRASQQTPVLLILEDLHWADQNSLLLLELIAQELSAHAVLVVATYRDGEMRTPLAQTCGELARVGVIRVALNGLSAEDTGQLMTGISGQSPPSEMVDVVHARTGGNPFFVTEIARLPSVDARAVPENVRAAISQRLTRLSPLANQILVVASVIGREFACRVVAAVLSDAAEESLLRALDEALQAALIEPLERRGDDWYHFKHELIRDAVYDVTSPSRRARWHAAILQTLERLHGPSVGDLAAELATHAARAEALVGSATVLKYSRMAGEQKVAAHAFEDALPHFERAWRARTAAPLDADAAAILFGLGCAQAATALRWNRQEGWLNLRRAIEYYLEASDVGRAVTAATHPSVPPEGASDVSEVIARVVAAVPRGSPQEGWLRARLGAAAYFETADYGRARVAFDRALEIAAVHRDSALELRTLAYETSVDHFDLRWQDVLSKSRRVLRLARRIDDPHSETYARYRAAYVLTHTGRTDEARAEVEANLTAAERLGDHGLLTDALFLASTLAHLTGDWREARAHSDRGLALTPRHLVLLHGRVHLEYETGQEQEGGRYLDRLLEAESFAGPYPLSGTFTAMALSQVAAISNRTSGFEPALAAARRILARPTSVPNAVLSARVSRGLWAIRDPRAGDPESDLEFVDPFDRIAPIQWWMVMARVLGVLAHAVGQPRRAIVRFESALAFCRRSGYRPELAWTCHDYAGVLLDTGSREDRLKAATLVDEAEQIANSLEMRPLAARLAGFRERYRVRLDRKPAGLTNRELEILRLIAAGKANKEIAQALFISPHTVAIHVAHVLAKTGASNRTGAAAYAARHHLFEPAVPPVSPAARATRKK
jgi:DNA-binding CsgD family transcriptional regulator/tetratricopeptide (TPR) repeat protein